MVFTDRQRKDALLLGLRRVQQQILGVEARSSGNVSAGPQDDRAEGEENTE